VGPVKLCQKSEAGHCHPSRVGKHYCRPAHPRGKTPPSRTPTPNPNTAGAAGHHTCAEATATHPMLQAAITHPARAASRCRPSSVHCKPPSPMTRCKPPRILAPSKSPAGCHPNAAARLPASSHLLGTIVRWPKQM
jgi:hypothetical protein